MYKGDKIVEKFELSNIEKATNPLICIYNNPSDYKGKVVARLWSEDKATNIIALAESMKEIRKAKPANMVIIPRRAKDDKVIVETWL